LCLTCHKPLRLHVFVEVWLDKGEPLLDTAFDVTTTISDISNHWATYQKISQEERLI